MIDSRTVGQVAYDSYTASIANPSAPAWTDLDSPTQSAWNAAAGAVIAYNADVDALIATLLTRADSARQTIASAAAAIASNPDAKADAQALMGLALSNLISVQAQIGKSTDNDVTLATKANATIAAALAAQPAPPVKP